MTDRRFDLALWLSPSSAWPDIVESRAVDAWALPYEIVQALMQKHGETYVFKAAVNTGSWPSRCYWHVRLPGGTSAVKLPVSVDEVVKQVWRLLEEDGIDQVEVFARDALGLARAACEIDGVLANWCQGIRAQEVRAFVVAWNERRSFEVRYRLLLEMDSEQSETRR